MPRVLIALALLASTATYASAQVVRVSVSTAGDQANGPSGRPSISADGRFVAFDSAATNLVAGDTNNAIDVFLRDRDVDADGVFDEVGQVSTVRVNPQGASFKDSLGAVISANGRYVFYHSNVATGIDPPSYDLFRWDRQASTTIRVMGPVGTTPLPSVSADGDAVVVGRFTDVVLRELAADRTTVLPAPYVVEPPPAGPLGFLAYYQPSISADGTRVLYATGVYYSGVIPPSDPRLYLYDHAAGTTTRVLGALDPSFWGIMPSLSASGETLVVWRPEVVRHVIETGAELRAFQGMTTPPQAVAVSPSQRQLLGTNAFLFDFVLGQWRGLNFVPAASAFSADDRWLVSATGTGTLLPGSADSNGLDDVYVFDLPDLMDGDDDTMDDRWEFMFGAFDPGADPDGDGQTNAQEENAGTHPNAQVRRFLAEGATGAFFHTAIALANPSPTLDAATVLTFDRGDGTRVRQPVVVPFGRSVVVDVGAVAGVEAADVSTTVESDRVVAVQREMTWRTPAGTIYGSHAESATAAPATTWFLAEGSTVLGFDLFYLLQNPQTTPAQATVRFLLPSGTTIMRTYTLAPGSRTTVYVNQVEGLDETDVSGDISADVPIVVERAMYRGSVGQPFSLGTDSMGVTAAATSWLLAEGATGAFFDLYVLIANPGNADANVQARYARPDGSVVTQTYTVRAHSRHSVYVDAIPGLDNTSVATTITSTNAVPIVAERAMYWPGGFFDYYEGHTSAGSTSTALEWVVAGGDNGGSTQAQTFVLIANTAGTAGEATLTILPDNGFTGTAPAPIVVPLPPTSRTTVPITAVTGSFGVRVVSTGGAPVPLAVESAVYRSGGGVLWSAGANALASPVP
jgi:hypothetical protein